MSTMESIYGKCFHCISTLGYAIEMTVYNPITVLKAQSLAFLWTLFIKKKIEAT